MATSKKAMKEALIKGWASVSERWRLFAYVVLGVLAVSLISNWVLSRSKRYPSHVVARVKTLVKDAAKWAAVAQQDQNPLMGLVHATYAMAYINVAREMFSAKDLQTLCGIDTDELYTMINHTQEQTAQQVGTQCPGLKLPGVFGLYSGWLG